MTNFPAYFGVAGFIIWALIERGFQVSKQQQSKGHQSDRGTYWLISICWYSATVLSILDGIYFHWTANLALLTVLRWVGIPLILIGLAARVMARQVLGRQYSAQVQTSTKHELVTSGIYSTLRHPAYLGLLALLLGIPLCCGSIPGLAVAVIGGIPAILNRIKVEETALLEWFGETYIKYSESTWRILPYIW